MEDLHEVCACNKYHFFGHNKMSSYTTDFHLVCRVDLDLDPPLICRETYSISFYFLFYSCHIK
jgi:hypothetical protein